MVFCRVSVGLGYSVHLSQQFSPGPATSMCGKRVLISKSPKEINLEEGDPKGLCQTCKRSALAAAD